MALVVQQLLGWCRTNIQPVCRLTASGDRAPLAKRQSSIYVTKGNSTRLDWSYVDCAGGCICIPVVWAMLLHGGGIWPAHPVAQHQRVWAGNAGLFRPAGGRDAKHKDWNALAREKEEA